MKPNDGSKMIKWGPKIETGNDPLPQYLIYKIILKVHKFVVHNLVNFVFLLIFASVIK